MPLAISLIVDGYVRLGDRDALTRLRAHRVDMLDSTRSIAEVDVSAMIAALREEIDIIDAGLSRLTAPREPQTPAPGGSGTASPDDSASRDPSR